MGNAFGHRRAHSQPAVLFLDIDGVLNSQASRRAGGDALEQGELPTFESQLPTAEMLALLAEIARVAPLRIVLVDVAVQARHARGGRRIAAHRRPRALRRHAGA